jgi:hypothetical protein
LVNAAMLHMMVCAGPTVTPVSLTRKLMTCRANDQFKPSDVHQLLRAQLGMNNLSVHRYGSALTLHASTHEDNVFCLRIES